MQLREVLLFRKVLSGFRHPRNLFGHLSGILRSMRSSGSVALMKTQRSEFNRPLLLTPFSSLESSTSNHSSQGTQLSWFIRTQVILRGLGQHFKILLHALASKKHPIVLFLDDIQRMDDDSKRLIEMFITDEEIQNVMFALCYRDEEAAAVADILQNFSKHKDH